MSREESEKGSLIPTKPAHPEFDVLDEGDITNPLLEMHLSGFRIICRRFVNRSDKKRSPSLFANGTKSHERAVARYEAPPPPSASAYPLGAMAPPAPGTGSLLRRRINS